MSSSKKFISRLGLIAMVILALSACDLGGTASSTTPTATTAAGSNAAVASPTTAGSSMAMTNTASMAMTGTTSTGGGNMSGTVMLGAALSQSKTAKVYGDSQSKAIQMAMAEINAAGGINGKQLTIDIQDDASDPKQAATVYQKFISDKVIAIIGPTLSNSAATADPLAQQAQIPVLAVSNTAGGIVDIGDYIFRDSLSEAQVIPNTIKVAKAKLNLTKVALIYGNDDAFTKAGYTVFKQALADNGITITTEQTFQKGNTNFSAQITAIKGSNPDAIVASALLPEGEGIIKEARNQGMALPIIGGNGFNSAKLMSDLSQQAEGVYVGAAWNSAGGNQMSQDFVKNFTAKYGNAPDQFAAQAYSGVYILADALKRAKSMSGADVRDALKTTHVTVPLGDFTFLPTRDANHVPVVQMVQGGKFVVVQ